jgi:hypothetical protein
VTATKPIELLLFAVSPLEIFRPNRMIQRYDARFGFVSARYERTRCKVKCQYLETSDAAHKNTEH